MALTDQSDIFASVTEDGLNRFAEHIMRKRPSLFNYGTQFVADNWQKLLCRAARRRTRGAAARQPGRHRRGPAAAAGHQRRSTG